MSQDNEKNKNQATNQDTELLDVDDSYVPSRHGDYDVFNTKTTTIRPKVFYPPKRCP